MIRSHVLICGGTGCTSSGSLKIQDEFARCLEANGLTEEVKIVQTGCFGLCALGPVVIIHPEGTFYSRVEPTDVEEIVTEHLLKGRVVERLVYADTGEEVKDITVFVFKNKSLMHNCFKATSLNRYPFNLVYS